MLLEIYEKGILTFQTVALYFHTITAFSFIISQGGKVCNKKRAADRRPCVIGLWGGQEMLQGHTFLSQSEHCGPCSECPVFEIRLSVRNGS